MQDRQQGFTLLEIMVVIFIISMSVALIISTGNGDTQKLVSIKNSLENDFNIARNQALLTHSLLVWQADDRGYQFSQMQVEEGQSNWQLIPINRKNFKPKTWQNGINWSYKKDKEWILVTEEESYNDYLDDASETTNSERKMPVRMLFSPNGRVINPINMRIYLNDRQLEFKYGILPTPEEDLQNVQ